MLPLCTFLAFSGISYAQTPGWSNDSQLTVNGSAFNPAIATDIHGNSHVVWNVGGSSIFYLKLDSYGNMAVNRTQVTGNNSQAAHPVISTDNIGNVYVVWRDQRFGDFEIMGRKFSNNGTNLTEEIRLTNANGSSSAPTIAIDDQRQIHISWEDSRDFYPSNSTTEIYYMKLNENLTKLIQDKKITDRLGFFITGSGKQPSLTADQFGNAHIAWVDTISSGYDIYYSQSNSSGNITVDPKRISLIEVRSAAPSIASDIRGNIHVAFMNTGTIPVGQPQDRPPEIFYLKLNNSGDLVVNATRLTFDGNFSGVLDGSGPSLGVDQNQNNNIVWMDNRTGAFEVWYTQLDNGGNTIIDDQQLTFAHARAEVPSLASDTRGQAIVWSDYRDPIIYPDIFYKRSIPFLNITDFAVVYSNLSDRLFRFGVQNIAGQNLSGINWRLNTGEVLINSTIQINLTIDEKLMVFVWYSYVNVGNFSIYATGFNQDVSATNKLQVLV